MKMTIIYPSDSSIRILLVVPIITICVCVCVYICIDIGIDIGIDIDVLTISRSNSAAVDIIKSLPSDLTTP